MSQKSSDDESSPAPAAHAPDTNAARSAPIWPQWLLLMACGFLSLECGLLALTLKGPWLILLAPSVVCGVRALEIWRDLRNRMTRNDQR